MSLSSSLLARFGDSIAESYVSLYEDVDISEYQGDYVIVLTYLDDNNEENISLLATTDDEDQANEKLDEFAELLGDSNVALLKWNEEDNQYGEVTVFEDFNPFDSNDESVDELFSWVIRGRKKVKKQLRKKGVRPKMSVSVRRKISRALRKKRYLLKRKAKLPSTKRKRKLSLKRRKSLNLRPTPKGYRIVGH